MADKTDRSDLAIGDTDEPAILVESYTASGNVTKGYPVELTNDGKVTVTPSTWYGFGVAKTDAVDGEKCSVVRVGRVKMAANGALTAAGVAVRNAGSGKVTELNDQPVDEGGSATYTIYHSRKLGTALNKADADGDLIFVDVGR